MIPTQTLESYPVFGDNSTKVQPDNAKYANGFVEGDVYPAEWVNWAWAKNTKGITDANAGISSIESEINSVLTEAGKTPDVTQNNQLLLSIKKLISDAEDRAKLAAHPVGSLYWSSVNTDPGTLFGGTWQRIKDKFILAAGDTYTNGNTGGAATVTLTTQQIPSHNHGMNNHTHTLTPSGSISVTTNPTFTGSSHTHSYTPAGSVSVTTNPTFTGSSHTHSYTPAGSVSVTTNPTFTGSAVNTGAMSGNSTGYIGQRQWSNSYAFSLSRSGNMSYETKSGGSSQYEVFRTDSAGYNSDNQQYIKVDVSHTHSVTASGSISGGAYKFTGTAASLSATQGGSISGGAYKFTGTAASLSATQGGSISGGAYSFTGTQGTTSQATGNTGSTGGGTSHENMPPYLVKYCWERTA